jgi:hypothetical protein
VNQLQIYVNDLELPKQPLTIFAMENIPEDQEAAGNMPGVAMGDKFDSVLLKLCRCGRIFCIISGQPLRKEPETWLPPGFKASRQPCRLCDKDYYIKIAYEYLKNQPSIFKEEPKEDL